MQVQPQRNGPTTGGDAAPVISKEVFAQIDRAQNEHAQVTAELKTVRQRVRELENEYAAVVAETEQTQDAVARLFRDKARATCALDDAQLLPLPDPVTIDAIRKHNDKQRELLQELQDGIEAEWSVTALLVHSGRHSVTRLCCIAIGSTQWQTQITKLLEAESRPTLEAYRARLTQELDVKKGELAELVRQRRPGLGPAFRPHRLTTPSRVLQEKKLKVQADFNASEVAAVVRLEAEVKEKLAKVQASGHDHDTLIQNLTRAERELALQQKQCAMSGRPDFSNPQTRVANLQRAIRTEEAERESTLDAIASMESKLRQMESRGGLYVLPPGAAVHGPKPSPAPAAVPDFMVYD